MNNLSETMLIKGFDTISFTVMKSTSRSVTLWAFTDYTMDELEAFCLKYIGRLPNTIEDVSSKSKFMIRLTFKQGSFKHVSKNYKLG